MVVGSRRIRLFVTLIASLGVLAATAVWSAREAASGAFTERARTAGYGKPIRPDQFGFALGGDAHNLTYDPALDRQLDTIRRTGGRWVRFDVNWVVAQPESPRETNWLPFDRLVAKSRARGLNVILTIVYKPPWVRPKNPDGLYAPNPRQFASFVKAVVRRYAPRGVHTYELWNEPNHPPFFKPRPDPRRYAAMLKAAYPAVKRIDPKAVVLTGGTSPGPTRDTRYSAPDFLAALYANGAGDFFDAVAHHPATFPGLPGEPNPFSAWYQMYGTKPSLRSVMRANGDGDKKIWATEWGVPTGGRPGSFVTEARQAKIYARAVRIWSTYKWAGKLIAYQVRDSGTSQNSRENHWGILRHDLSPKPVVATLRRLVARK